MKTQKTSASFILTEKCNLRCKYCFECYDRKIGPDMTKEVAAKALDLLFEEAAKNPQEGVNVTLFGGEPLLRLELCDFIVTYGIKKRDETGIRFSIGIITNGTIMNDEIELYIRRWKSKINVTLQVSVDGCREAQDLYRVHADGSSSFDEVVRNIPVFNNLDPKTCLHGCLNKLSLPYLFESYQFFVEELKHRNSIWFMPIHSEEWDEEDVKIYDEQLGKIFEYETENLHTVSSYTPIDKLLGCGENTAHEERTCGAGVTYLSFTGTGDIYPCHNFYFSKDASPDLEDYKIGNVFDANPLANTAVLDRFLNCCVKNTECKDCKNVACYRCIADNWRFAGDILNQVGINTARCKMSSVEHKWQLKALEWAKANVPPKEKQKNTEADIDKIYDVLRQVADGLIILDGRLTKLENKEDGGSSV